MNIIMKQEKIFKELVVEIKIAIIFCNKHEISFQVLEILFYKLNR